MKKSVIELFPFFYWTFPDAKRKKKFFVSKRVEKVALHACA